MMFVMSTNLANVLNKLVDGTTLTDSSGNYAFHDVPCGSYFVTETNLASFTLDVSDINGGSRNTIGVTLGSGNPFNSLGKNFQKNCWPCDGGHKQRQHWRLTYPGC